MDARRTLIADAALTVIGVQGMRSLTHLAVDAEAGLPKGSTSYYCRRRVDLLALSLTRLYALDTADIADTSERLRTGPRDRSTITREVSALIVRWLTPPIRTRTVARFELFLAVSHEPELQPLLQDQVSGIVGLVETVGAVTDPPGLPEQTLAVLMLAEGVMLSNVRLGQPTPSQADVERLMGTIAPDHP